MRFEADVVQCDTATFRPLPSQRSIESRAEAHLENATLELFPRFPTTTVPIRDG